jgi:hypothetical protein
MEKITVAQQFVTLKLGKHFPTGNFDRWFADMPFVAQKSTLHFKRLEKPMSDEEILAQLKPTEVSLGEVFDYVSSKEAQTHGCFLLFFCRDKDNVLRIVQVGGSYDEGWDMSGLQFPNPHEEDYGPLYNSDYIVGSRNSL